jgi:hypothetical protein
MFYPPEISAIIGQKKNHSNTKAEAMKKNLKPGCRKSGRMPKASAAKFPDYRLAN